MNKSVLKFIYIIGLTLFPAAAWPQSQTPDAEMILSKKDAATMFQLSRIEWNSNVVKAVSAGAARATGDEKHGYVMHTELPGSILSVRPFYEKPDKPDFIQVTVGYREPMASLMSLKRVQESIEKAKNELKPEFNVMGEVKRHKEGIGVYFTIMEGS